MTEINAQQRKCAKYFSKELNYIKNYEIKNLIMDFIDTNTPDYFWKIPASTSGKYHPAYTLVEGGLVLHTKAAVSIAISLFELYDLSETSKDIIISALILHDMFKCGYPSKYKENKTVFNHPLVCAEAFTLFLKNRYKDVFYIQRWANKISDCIASHMGKWNTSNFTNDILPIPETIEEKIVHLCDYLSSRKDIIVNVG